jgi:hypothetical protein
MAIRTNGDSAFVGVGSKNIVAPTITTNNYTLVLADKDRFLELNNSTTAATLTVPPNSSVPFPIGAQIDLLQIATGQFTITAGAGVTINGTPGLKLRTQWASATLIKRATDTWVLVGDLSA